VQPDADSSEGVGCAAVTWAALALVLIGTLLWTAGILLEDPTRCTGGCEWTAFTLIFAGAPVSALITVLGGSDLVVAWPVDVLVWVLIGVAHTKLSREAPPLSRAWTRTTATIVGAALVYGAVLALFVERAT
jgi:hypothetical protein